jgi:hypothetical protein
MVDSISASNFTRYIYLYIYICSIYPLHDDLGIGDKNRAKKSIYIYIYEQLKKKKKKKNIYLIMMHACSLIKTVRIMHVRTYELRRRVWLRVGSSKSTCANQEAWRCRPA